MQTKLFFSKQIKHNDVHCAVGTIAVKDGIKATIGTVTQTYEYDKLLSEYDNHFMACCKLLNHESIMYQSLTSAAFGPGYVFIAEE